MLAGEWGLAWEARAVYRGLMDLVAACGAMLVCLLVLAGGLLWLWEWQERSLRGLKRKIVASGRRGHPQSVASEESYSVDRLRWRAALRKAAHIDEA